MNLSTDAAEKKPAQDKGASARKFLFDRSFDDEVLPNQKGRGRIKQTFTAEQLEAAKKEAQQEGFNAGQKAMMENQQQYTNVLLTQISQHLEKLVESSQEQWKKQLAHLQEMALGITKKILPAYAARQGLGEIEAIVAQVIGEMAHEPRLVIRVGEAQFDAVSSRIKDITEQKAYTGKVVVLCEAGLGPADCRVEWADGGIERDMNALWQSIDRLMESVQSLPTDKTQENGVSGENS